MSASSSTFPAAEELLSLARAGDHARLTALFEPLTKTATTRGTAWSVLEAACERAASGIPFSQDKKFFEREIRQLGPVVAWRDGRITEQRSVSWSSARNLRVLSSPEEARVFIERDGEDGLGAASASWGARPGAGEPADLRAHALERQRLMREGDVAGLEAYRARFSATKLLTSHGGELLALSAWNVDSVVAEAAQHATDAAVARWLVGLQPPQLALRFGVVNAMDDDARLPLLEVFLAAVEDVNAEFMGDTLLARATRVGREGVVDLLLGRGADADHAHDPFTVRPPIETHSADGNGPMVNAVRRSDAAMLTKLLAAGGDPFGKTRSGRRVVDLAREIGNAAIVEQLLAGREELGEVDMPTAVAQGDAARILALAPAEGTSSAIQTWACQADRAQALRAVLASGLSHDAKILAKGLANASLNGHVDNVKALLDHGADPNGAETVCGTALKSAQYNNHHEIVALLKKAGGKTRLPKK